MRFSTIRFVGVAVCFYMLFREVRVAAVIVGKWFRRFFRLEKFSMEDLASDFSARLALTEEEQQIVVVEKKDGLLLKTTKVFLVGKVLTRKPLNIERFKKQMQFLWRPKARVTIVELAQNLFSFGFDSARDRSVIHRGGPCLFDGSLLVLAEADDLTQPNKIPLRLQELWVQLKGIPPPYMTRQKGQFIGNQLGEYVVADQSRKGKAMGSILRVRTIIYINKPLRRSLFLKIEGNLIEVDVGYEKLPLTCFLCGMVNHIEE